MRCSFTFGQIEELLSVAHRIDPVRRIAFNGRLKHLQRWGFPSGEKPGKGKAISYTVEHLFKMVVALELIQAGVPPKLAVDLISDNWHDLRVTAYLNMFSEGERRVHSGSPADWCWLFRPEALRALTVEGEGKYDHCEAVVAAPTSELTKFIGADLPVFGSSLGTYWRTLVINGGPLVRGILNLIEFRFKWASAADLRRDLLEACEVADRKIQEGAAEIRKVMGNWRPSDPPAAKKVAERFPPRIVSAATEVLSTYRDQLQKLDVPDGELIELSKDDLLTLQDSRLIELAAEGVVQTEMCTVALELLREERNDDHNP